MLSVLGFLAVLCPLVIVHEFGHYIFARIFGVKAEVFSIGFGPKLWSRQCGETELRLSAIPLGGYVKLLGEEGDKELSPEDKKRALTKQSAWKRFFIFFGGPFFNFVFAVFAFMAIMAIGEPQLSSIVGRAVDGSAAAKAGFQSGDRIVKVEDKQVVKFDDVISAINDRPGQAMHFEVLHQEKPQIPATVVATPTAEPGFSMYGEATQVGNIDGLLPMARSTQIGVSDPESPAGRAGIKTGNKLVAINGKPVSNWEEAERIFTNAPAGAELRFKIEANTAAREVAFIKPATPAKLGSAFGLHSSELFIEKVTPKSPAEGIGLSKGDRLIGIGEQRVESFFDLRDAVQKFGEKDGKVNVRWEHAGKQMSVTTSPTATSSRDPALKKTTQYTIGVVPMLVWAQPATFVERVWNPFVLTYKGIERTVVFSWRNLVSLRKIITGDVSIGTLGGPILIGKIAGESLSHGLIAFLTTMAILSVGLGILNILPIPVLDGGHLLLLSIESIRRKPLSVRQTEIIQQVGLSLILLLMVVVLRNDIIRLPFFD